MQSSLADWQEKRLESILSDIPSSFHEPLFAMVSDTYERAKRIERTSRYVPLGAVVATDYFRTALFSLMTASATLDLKQRGFEDISVLELGVGMGSNALAALSVGASSVFGIDKDAECIRNTEELARTHGYASRVRVVQADFLTYDLSGQRFDIIVNENLSKGMYGEPLMGAALAGRKAAKSHTHFVPYALDVAVEHDYFIVDGHQVGGRQELTSVLLGNITQLPVECAIKGTFQPPPESRDSHLGIAFQLRDYRRRVVLGYGEESEELALSSGFFLTQGSRDYSIPFRWGK